MIKELFKPLKEQETNICTFRYCEEPCTCFYKKKPVCSKHYFEVRRILSVYLKAKREENK